MPALTFDGTAAAALACTLGKIKVAEAWLQERHPAAMPLRLQEKVDELCVRTSRVPCMQPRLRHLLDKPSSPSARQLGVSHTPSSRLLG